MYISKASVKEQLPWRALYTCYWTTEEHLKKSRSQKCQTWTSEQEFFLNVYSRWTHIDKTNGDVFVF